MRRQKVEDCKELAHKAGQWISFDPDRYGEGLLDSMEAELQVFLGKMKEHGYKWSPANKAWQRQITPNAAYSTKKLLEELEHIFTENEK